MNEEPKSGKSPYQQNLSKAMRFCAYQERTQQEVREKLAGLGVWGDEAEEMISRLITENFINEERYAKTYAGGKFRLKKWGRMKILQGLKQKGISEYSIKKGMQEIESDLYIQTLENLLEEKSRMEKEKNPYKRKHKISLYLIGKGYEPDLVWELLRKEL